MLEALLLGAVIETTGIGPKPLACSFPGAYPGEPAIEVTLTPRPSLKDLPGLFRVEMALTGGLRLPAAAQPITSTEGQDVLVRAGRAAGVHYTLGIDLEGHAAFNMLVHGSASEASREATRTGRCRNHERYIERWSAL